jgi:hypothetical protein
MFNVFMLLNISVHKPTSTRLTKIPTGTTNKILNTPTGVAYNNLPSKDHYRHVTTTMLPKKFDSNDI